MRDAPDPSTRERLHEGLAAGLTATLVMTGLVFAAPALGGPRVPAVAAHALASLRVHPLWLAAGLVAHLGYGALAGAVFMGGARAVSIGRGVAFSLGLWAIAVSVYAPLVGLGFVASHRPGLAALALPAHLLYGVVLGALGPRGEIVQPLDDAEPA